MKIPFEIWITIQTVNVSSYKKLCVSLDHNLTKEDLDEFVEKKEYDSVESYFKTYVDDEQELNEIMDYYKQDKTYLLEPEIEVYCKDKQALENFLRYKYADEVLSKFCDNISYNEDLNNLE